MEAANTSATAGPAATDNGMRTVATEENMAASGGSERAEAELVNEALQLFDLFDGEYSSAQGCHRFCSRLSTTKRSYSSKPTLLTVFSMPSLGA